MADYVIQMLGSVEVVDGLSLAFGILHLEDIIGHSILSNW